MMRELLLICNLFVSLSDLEKSHASNLELPVQECFEFVGSLDLDENDRLVIRHFPLGQVKPAVVYIHPMIFEKRSLKLKAYKYIDKNVKVFGHYMKLGDLEFIYVKDIELIMLDA